VAVILSVLAKDLDLACRVEILHEYIQDDNLLFRAGTPKDLACRGIDPSECAALKKVLDDESNLRLARYSGRGGVRAGRKDEGGGMKDEKEPGEVSNFILLPSSFILSVCPHPCPLPEYRARGDAFHPSRGRGRATR
jgi:hypothetical protein